MEAAIGHGNFLPWLEAEFGWSDRVAAHLMNVAIKFENFSNLESVSPSALYILAAPSTPDEVRVEFTELAARAEKRMKASKTLVTSVTRVSDPNERKTSAEVAQAVQLGSDHTSGRGKYDFVLALIDW